MKHECIDAKEWDETRQIVGKESADVMLGLFDSEISTLLSFIERGNPIENGEEFSRRLHSIVGAAGSVAARPLVRLIQGNTRPGDVVDDQFLSDISDCLTETRYHVAALRAA